MKLTNYIKDIILKNSTNILYAERYIRLLENSVVKADDKIEKHHILPKSLYPEFNKDKNNYIKLSPRIHYIAHKMLVRVFRSKQMWSALWAMSVTNDKKQAFKLSGKEYEKLRLAISSNTSDRFSGEKSPSFVRSKAGTHWNIGKGSANYKLEPWNSFSATTTTKTFWYYSDVFYELFKSDCKIKSTRFLDKLSESLGINIGTIKLSHNILNKFRNGWNPSEDTEWIKFKQNFEPIITFKIWTKKIYKPNAMIGLKPWKNKSSSDISLRVWSDSNYIYEIFKSDSDSKLGWRKLQQYTIKRLGYVASNGPIQNMLQYFRRGWIPDQDSEWIEFKDTYKQQNGSIQ